MIFLKTLRHSVLAVNKTNKQHEKIIHIFDIYDQSFLRNEL